MPTIIDLGKLRFNFAGDWVSGTVYEFNDVVKYGGNVYVYKYALKEAGHLPTEDVYWALLVEGISFTGVYSTVTTYKAGEVVIYGGRTYVAIDASTNTPPPNPTYWSMLSDGVQYEGDYDNSTSYQKNDMVLYGSNVFIAKSSTLGNLPTNPTYWDELISGIDPQGAYNNAVTYYPNDIVAYGAGLYRALSLTIGNEPTNATYWESFVGGMRTRGSWATATTYYVGDIVRYGGNTFSCTAVHASTSFASDLSASRWTKFNGGLRYRDTWLTGTSYLADDIIYDGTASTYIALQDFVGGVSVAADVSAGNLALLARGGNDTGIPAVSSTTYNKILSNNGTSLVWADADFLRYVDISFGS